MSGYLVNFIVYTAAMVGIIFLAVFVYKKFSYCSTSRSKFLNVEECISLGPRKELFVVRAGQERFHVASEVGRTSLISKLDDNSPVQKNEIVSSSSSSSVLKTNTNCSVDDLPTIVDFPRGQRATAQKKVFKNIINNI